MVGAGEIEIATAGCEGDVVLRVADSGSGIASEHMPSLFDPFFTTKEEGKGAGLGLAVSYAIVQEHGGRITAHNRRRGGAEFLVTLPRSPATGDAEAVSVVMRRRASGATLATAARSARRCARGLGRPVQHARHRSAACSAAPGPGRARREAAARGARATSATSQRVLGAHGVHDLGPEVGQLGIDARASAGASPRSASTSAARAPYVASRCARTSAPSSWSRRGARAARRRRQRARRA